MRSQPYTSVAQKNQNSLERNNRKPKSNAEIGDFRASTIAQNKMVMGINNSPKLSVQRKQLRQMFGNRITQDDTCCNVIQGNIKETSPKGQSPTSNNVAQFLSFREHFDEQNLRITGSRLERQHIDTNRDTNIVLGAAGLRRAQDDDNPLPTREQFMALNPAVYEAMHRIENQRDVHRGDRINSVMSVGANVFRSKFLLEHGGEEYQEGAAHFTVSNIPYLTVQAHNDHGGFTNGRSNAIIGFRNNEFYHHEGFTNGVMAPQANERLWAPEPQEPVDADFDIGDLFS